MEIIELNKKNLKEASKLIDGIFYDEDYKPSIDLKLSLKKEGIKKLNEIFKTDIIFQKYWVAVNNKGSVIGIIGLYSEKPDNDIADWLGWYGVDKKQRRKGVGSKLLDFVSEKSKKRRKKIYKTVDIHISL